MSRRPFNIIESTAYAIAIANRAMAERAEREHDFDREISESMPQNEREFNEEFGDEL